jgi:hypothetical protein
MYKEKCAELKLKDEIRFGTDLSNHFGINITPLKNDSLTPYKESPDIFASREKYEIYDINILRLKKHIEKLSLDEKCYFRPVYLGSVITENFNPFYFPRTVKLPKKFRQKVKCAFSLRNPRKQVVFNNENLQYFNERFLKDVKEGKGENIKRGLEIYAQIFDLENKIINQC